MAIMFELAKRLQWTEDKCNFIILY